MKACAAALALIVAGAGTAALAQPAPGPLIKPGLWETTTVIEDSAAATRRSIVGRTCVQASDAAVVQRLIPGQRERDMQCENRDIRNDGSGWTWTVQCRSPEATQTGTGRMVLSGESYLGRAEIELRRKGAKAVKVEQTYSGKWLQDCT